MDYKIFCPYCGAEGTPYHKTWITILHPLLLLDKKFYCNKCQEIFIVPLKPGQQPKPKKNTGADKILKILDKTIKFVLVIFIIWLLYSIIREQF